MVVMFTADRCPHCERMLAETYADPAIGRLLVEHAETALAHAADYAELAQKLGVRGYPTTVIVAADGRIVDAVEGYVDAPTFAARLMPWIGPAALDQRSSHRRGKPLTALGVLHRLTINDLARVRAYPTSSIGARSSARPGRLRR